MKRVLILHPKERKALSPQGNKQYAVTLFPWAHGALELPVNPSSMLFLCLSLRSLSKLVGMLPSRGMGNQVSSREQECMPTEFHVERKQSLRSIRLAFTWTFLGMNVCDLSASQTQDTWTLAWDPKGKQNHERTKQASSPKPLWWSLVVDVTTWRTCLHQMVHRAQDSSRRTTTTTMGRPTWNIRTSVPTTSPSMQQLKLLNGWESITLMTMRDDLEQRAWKEQTVLVWSPTERLLLNHANTPGFLAPGGEEFNRGQRGGLIPQSFCVIKFY